MWKTPQHGVGTATHPHLCMDVARARVSVPGDVNKRLRVFTGVKGVDFCEVEVLSPQAQAEKRGWEVTTMFPMEVRLDTKRGDRVLRTLAFFKTFIPYPCDEEQDGSDLRKSSRRALRSGTSSAVSTSATRSTARLSRLHSPSSYTPCRTRSSPSAGFPDRSRSGGGARRPGLVPHPGPGPGGGEGGGACRRALARVQTPSPRSSVGTGGGT